MAADQRETVALVTGVAHGIGFEVCRQLAERGMTVILTARAPEKAEAAAEQLAGDGLDVRPRALDVSDDESVRALAAELEREFGRLDVLVNNAAAYTDWSEIASTADLGAARAVLETNPLGRWRLGSALAPLAFTGLLALAMVSLATFETLRASRVEPR